MIVRTERTANPATVRFLPEGAGAGWSEAGFAEPAAAARSPLARRLFRIGGVKAVALGPGFAAVTKADDADWARLAAPVREAVAEYCEAGARLRAGGGGRAAALAPALEEIWEYTEGLPRLGDRFDIRRGIPWKTGYSLEPDDRDEREGCVKCLHSTEGMSQFVLPAPAPFDYRRTKVGQVIGAWVWNLPKILLKASGTGGGAWRMAAAFDKEGLLYFRQVIGLWPRFAMGNSELPGYSAIINGPFANAFLSARDKESELPIDTVKSIPVPEGDPGGLGKLVESYTHAVRRARASGEYKRDMENLLTRIDAAALDMYKLPARLERKLLSVFRGSRRPAAHPWRHWDEAYPAPGQTLAERVSGKFRGRGAWVLDVFRPLPENEAALFGKYGV